MIKTVIHAQQSYRQDNDSYADMVSHMHLIKKHYFLGIRVFKLKKDIMPHPDKGDPVKKTVGYS